MESKDVDKFDKSAAHVFGFSVSIWHFEINNRYRLKEVGGNSVVRLIVYE